MVNYPNGQKVVKPSEQQINHSRANMGMQLEHDVIISCNFYKDQNRALIYKRPTPIKVCKMDKNNRTHITDAYFDEKSTTDFNGIYRQKYLDFECKETIKDALTLSKIRPQQIRHLRQVQELGGLAFFVVRFKAYNETYLLDAKYILDAQSKTFKRSFYMENGVLIKPGFQPRLYLLEAVDEEYFNVEVQKVS